MDTMEKIAGIIERMLLPRLSELSGKMDSMNARIDSLESNINTKLESVNTQFKGVDIKIQSLDDKITSLRNETMTRQDSILWMRSYQCPKKLQLLKLRPQHLKPR